MEIDKTATILVADDDEFYRHTMRVMLHGMGFLHIREAHDGQEALSVGKECKPLFALIDIYMPHMNGWDVVKKFNKELPDTILVMVTGSRNLEDIDEAFRQGIDGYFLKPCKQEMVLETLTKLVAQRNEKKA